MKPTYLDNWRVVCDSFSRSTYTIVAGGKETPTRGRDKSQPDRYEVFIEIGGNGREVDHEKITRMISALPEMMEALEKGIEIYGKFGALVNEPHSPGEWIVMAKGAIEKAKLKVKRER